MAHGSGQLGLGSERLAAIGTLDFTVLQPAFDRVIRLASAHAQARADVIIVGAKHNWSATDLAWSHGVPVDATFSAEAVRTAAVLWVEDAREDLRFRDHPHVRGGPLYRFYAGAPICLASGTVIGTVCVVGPEPRAFEPELIEVLTDLAAIVATECGQHRTQQDLVLEASRAAQASQMLAMFVESAPFAVCLVDSQMSIIQASKRWRWEHLEGDVMSSNLYQAFPQTKGWSEHFAKSLSGEPLQEDLLPILGSDGSPRWVRAEITPWRGADGAVAGLMVMSVDVTPTVTALEEARRAGERLELAIEIGRLQAWEIDFRRRELSSAGLTAVPEATYDALKTDIWANIHPEDRPAAVAEWDRCLEAKEPFRHSYRMIQPDGSALWFDSACHPVHDDRGEIVRLVGVIRNIDDQKRAEFELTQARDEAEAANRAKSEFLANMSHEIRTPLNGVMGIAGALAKTHLADDQAEMVGLIATSAQTLEALLTDILDLARIEAGKLEIRPEAFDLATSVNACASLFQASAEAKDLALVVQIDDAVLGHYQGDAPRIRQVLSNLLSNAVKFTTSGEVRLRVTGTRDETLSHLVFEVADTGIGFDAEAKARLFGRFQQADGSITRQYGGTGLGLAISRSLAQAMGGELTASSEPGLGSTFRLALSLLPRQGRSQLRGTAISEISDAAQLDSMRVLLAEDHPTNRRVVELILGAAGIDLTSVENGAEAVDLARRSRFDLILMDMQMPVMDGLTAIRAIRLTESQSNHSAIPIYTLTANAMPEHEEASRLAGATGHLTKPISAERLLAVVEQVWSGEATETAGQVAMNG